MLPRLWGTDAMISDKKLSFYRDLARTASLQSTCPRAQVGAILVGGDRVLGLGYNGAPRGTPHCAQLGCLIDTDALGRGHCYRAVHAEANALVNAAYTGSATKDATMISTYSPCVNCLKLLINAGIEGVVYEKYYTDVRSENLLALKPSIWVRQL